MAGTGKTKMLGKSIGIGIATLLSRILGLVRVRLEASVLGGGDVASAWFLAFMIPNLFRRLFGEGALGTALMPLLAESDKQHGSDQVRRELAVIFTVLGTLLALISFAVSVGALGSLWYCERKEILLPVRIRLMLQLLPMLMPYAIFICLVGVIGSVLNYARIFFLPALGALLLNIFLIGGLSAAWFFQMPPERFLPMLSLLVPLSGVCQLLLMAWLLHHCGFFPDWRRCRETGFDIIGKLVKLALPGFIGATALQLSFVADRSLAVILEAQAVPALTYVDRLIDLPIGIFAVSLGAVLMTEMSRSASSGALDEIADQLNFCLRHVFFLCIPIGMGVVFFYEPMLRLLCLGGSYTMSDLDAARLVAIFYGSGIPFFCSLKVILPAFHARKKMVTTLKVSLLAIFVNLSLNLILMWPLKQGGLALATVISSMVHNSVLLFLLYKEGFDLAVRRLIGTILRSAIIALAAALVMHSLWQHLFETFSMNRGREFLMLMLFGTGFLGLYCGFSAILRAPELKETFPLLLRRRKK